MDADGKSWEKWLKGWSSVAEVNNNIDRSRQSQEPLFNISQYWRCDSRMSDALENADSQNWRVRCSRLPKKTELAKWLRLNSDLKYLGREWKHKTPKKPRLKNESRKMVLETTYTWQTGFNISRCLMIIIHGYWTTTIVLSLLLNVLVRTGKYPSFVS